MSVHAAITAGWDDQSGTDLPDGAARSQTLRHLVGGDYFTRYCYGRCLTCSAEMWDLDERGVLGPHRPTPTPGCCVECSFWADMAATEHDARRVVVNGQHHILTDTPGAAPASAPTFCIEFFDGRLVRGYLTSQGTIPEAWRDRLPDNARVAPERRAG